MTTPAEAVFAVRLYGERIGVLHQRGDHTRFRFDEAYLATPDRPVLGLRFEQAPERPHSSKLRLPPWFSNLLPEGQLRDWIAADRGVKPAREMELLAQVGHDLPGAVTVVRIDPDGAAWEAAEDEAAGRASADGGPGWRFSLAGVALKFSMVRRGDRLTLPAAGEGGDWIVKLPDHQYADVPRNEFTMMTLAVMAGIDVPEVRLVHRDDLTGLPAGVWPGSEAWAYAVRRFDRDERGLPVHIEDLAQVLGRYPDRKYEANFETVAALFHRRRDVEALREFTRRLTFNILIANGDAHLKNWSLIYRDPRSPTISPAYDLVATTPYRGPMDGPEDLGLKFRGTRRFEMITVETFDRLERRLGARGAGLAECAAAVVDRVRDAWPAAADHLRESPVIRDHVTATISDHGRSLLRTRTPVD